MSDQFQISDVSKETTSTEVWRGTFDLLTQQGFSKPRDQWLRKISLITYDEAKGNAIELSNLRINFIVHKATNQSPNLLQARVYNMAPATMARVIEFKKVQLMAGYQTGSFGVIFKGTVVNYVRGKENPVDTYLDIIGGDGDRFLNEAITVKAWPKGTSDQQILIDHWREMSQASGGDDVAIGFMPKSMSNQKSIRGQVYSGMSRDGVRELMNKYKADFWSDDGKLCFLPRKAYLPGEAVVLSPRTGLVGMPQVTPQGIQARCLLNSKLRLGGLVKIESANLSGVQYVPGTAAKTDAQGNVIPGDAGGGLRFEAATWGQQLAAAYTSPIGLYKILLLEYTGDTRSNPWYADMVCIAVGTNGAVIQTGIPGEATQRTIADTGDVSGLDASKVEAL